jgi:hypothetical protein
VIRRALFAIALVVAAAAPADDLPDLVLDLPTLRTSFEELSFPPTACELQAADRCVDAAGARKLLRFSVFALNRGGDLVLGTPRPDDPMWVFSACHNHYHFETFAHYEIRSTDGSGTTWEGQKRSFCVEDSLVADPTVPHQRKYCCDRTCNSTQGLQHGWGDLYPDTLPCQWIDVTDVPPGDYQLCVQLNFAHKLPESDYTNDGGCVPVHVSAPDPRFGPPKVRVTSPQRRAKAHVGRTLRVRWHALVRGDPRFQELWFSADDGQSWEFVTNGFSLTARTYRWPVPATAVSDQARVKVVSCARNPKGDPGAGALQCGVGVSRPFRVVP